EKRFFTLRSRPNPGTWRSAVDQWQAAKVPGGMVVHNDKWKRKATREYHKKHGTLSAGQGRGRGRGRGVVDNEPVPGLVDDAESDDGSHEEDGAEIEFGDH